MNAGPNRWARVEQLYHAAVALPIGSRAAFLAKACAGDDALRREVESLLAQPASADDLLARGAVVAAAGLVSDAGNSTLTGQRIGAYQVLAPIGAGGMGEVYRARDTRLGRDVAIKILPAEFTSNPDRLARFEREARVLASLNHPHIGAIYGIEDAPAESGSHLRALVLELVEGETLAERIARRKGAGLPMHEALDISRQIADALDAAHEKGIVHRDLKPANIKITPEGVVKVLDFGLAKLEVLANDEGGTASPTITVGDTREGLVIGTAAYMSPEQARGQAVDKRTDIWAFGCVLYEMLTGRAAFARNTVTDTLAAVVSGQADWNAMPADTPANARHLLVRSLDRDARRRLRDIGDARIEIEEALASPQVETPQASRSAGAFRTWRVAVVALGALAVAGAVVAAALMIRSRATASALTDSMTRMIATRLTDYGANETAAALSPDGRSFVFASDHGGTPDIWLRQVAGGDAVRLTNDVADERDLSYAPDGGTVYFTRVDASGQGIWQVGALGGQARKVLGDALMPVPSPDGRRLAYFYPDPDNSGLWALGVSALNDEHRQPLARRIGFGSSRAAWSRDGRWLAYSRGALFGPVNLFVIELSTGRERQVTHFAKGNEGITRGSGDGSLQWLPDNRHLLVSYVPVARQLAPNDLGILDVQTGAIARLTTSEDSSYTQASISADGSRAVVSAVQFRSEVWRVPLGPDADANGRAAIRVMDSRGLPMWTFVSRDGHVFLFNGTATGSRNLWLTRLDDKTAPRQVTALPNDVVSHSSLSPDGTHVAFAAITTGNSDIWTQNIDGSDLRQLTNDEAADSWPVWSPDGRAIVFSTARSGGQETWLVPAVGGRAEKLIDGFFRGDWIAHSDGRSLIVASNGGTGVRLIDVQRRSVVWEKNLAGAGVGLPMFSPDGRAISMPVAETRDHSTIQILDTSTGTPRLAVRLLFPVLFRASWVDNGTALAVNRFDRVSHIVMFDRFWTNDRAQ